MPCGPFLRRTGIVLGVLVDEEGEEDASTGVEATQLVKQNGRLKDALVKYVDAASQHHLVQCAEPPLPGCATWPQSRRQS